MRTKDLAYIALFTALIAAGAYIRIPVPVVPFTLQFLFTNLAGLLLGAKKRGGKRRVLYCIGAYRTACIYRRRRNILCF